MTNEEVWTTLRREAEAVAAKEPFLSKVLTEFVLERDSFADALGWRLAARLGRSSVPEKDLRELIRDAFLDDAESLDKVCSDVRAVRERDPACRDFLSPFLYFKGFQALAGFRAANYLWRHDRRELAQYLQSLIAAVYAVDVHPAADVGKGILLDHATGFVAGETTVIEDNVSILHEVTLGGTGKERGDRHPKIRSGVLIGAGAKILGNVEIGEGARIGAGSVVLKDVPPHVSVAGVPAKELGQVQEASPALGMDHVLDPGEVDGGEAI
jgi:serine O-acetyltransferase|tara:strand:- start:1088 stop:1894 length:807 start_codon:yes stop_codon:yes gene_type:complete